jgi:hypothetical protein
MKETNHEYCNAQDLRAMGLVYCEETRQWVYPPAKQATPAHTPLPNIDALIASAETAIDWLIETPKGTDQYYRGYHLKKQLEAIKLSKQFIVTACNSHDALLEAAKNASKSLDYAVNALQASPGSNMRQTLVELRAAIAQAEGK